MNQLYFVLYLNAFYKGMNIFLLSFVFFYLLFCAITKI
ncbi:hypothetical protein CLOLEP_01301 [[Clostridium] leptum DSM 753]|uniref:Uncharacterized protein n=1 Tax=[Clostridium] leptum DSM 753 TaxID=428125 RepID=A7VRW4_9FIRM|nr:hypothetical protein CLOLEP_01301 [[Clostridium] leptum DSM 753]